MEARERVTKPDSVIEDALRLPPERSSVPARSAAAKRRSMQGAMAAAVIALRSQERPRTAAG